MIPSASNCCVSSLFHFSKISPGMRIPTDLRQPVIICSTSLGCVALDDTIQLLISHISEAHQIGTIQAMIHTLNTNVRNISDFGP